MAMWRMWQIGKSVRFTQYRSYEHSETTVLKAKDVMAMESIPSSHVSYLQLITNFRLACNVSRLIEVVCPIEGFALFCFGNWFYN